MSRRIGRFARSAAVSLLCVAGFSSMAWAGDRGDRYARGSWRADRYDDGAAWTRQRDVADARLRIDIRSGPAQDWRPAPPVCAPPVLEERVWVEPVYRTVCQRVWVPATYRTVTDRVWVEPVVERRTQRVWVPDRFEWRESVCYERGYRVVRREHVLVEPGHYEYRDCEVVIQPGYFKECARQELVCEGRWDTVERQELVSAGYWTTRRVDPVPAWDHGPTARVGLNVPLRW